MEKEGNCHHLQTVLLTIWKQWSPQGLLELSNVARQINRQKSIIFLYTYNIIIKNFKECYLQ